MPGTSVQRISNNRNTRHTGTGDGQQKKTERKGKKGEDRMEIKIRQAAAEEAVWLAQIEAECFPAAEAATLEEIEARMALFPENFLVAEADDTVVGFINGGTTDQPYLPDALYHDASLHRPDGAWQTVFGLNVLPQYRCCGIAAQLVEAFAELARVRGKAGVILTCKEEKISYYEHRGFVKYGRADSCHGGAVWHDMRMVF